MVLCGIHMSQVTKVWLSFFLVLLSFDSRTLGSAHWSPISLVPHLIRPLLISPPTHWSPNTLLELIVPPSHWSPISLVPQLIGPPFHSSPHHRQIPMVPHLIGPPSHWFPISLVPQLISPHLIGPPISTHASPIPLVPHLIGPPDSLVPHLNGPPSHWTLLTGWVPTALFELISPPSPNVTLSALHLIGPPILHFLPCYHWSSISLVPNVILLIQFSLVPDLIGPPMRPWLHSSHWSPISLVPQCDPDYTVPIGPLISLVPQCNPGYTVLIGPPSHWSPM